jgi:hypothetical protein
MVIAVSNRQSLFMLTCLWVSLVLPVLAADGHWIEGKWEQSYDPAGSAQDYLEFLPNGDVSTIAANGTRTEGMYVVTEDRVTVVFSRHGKDVIATFFFDTQHQELRIVTDRSGKETLYRKIPASTNTP